MTNKKVTSQSGELSDGARPPVIRVVVGYPWAKDDDNHVVAAIADARWKCIRDCVISERERVKKFVARRLPAPVLFDFDVSRLRGTHGRMLLDNLRSRITEADILIMDIGARDGKGLNCNVLLETGMSIAQENGPLRDLFILKPANFSAPSDLQGFLFSDYRVISQEGAIKIIDSVGFQAALRSAIVRKAREFNMVGPRSKLDDDPDDEYLDYKPPQSGRDGGSGDGAGTKSGLPHTSRQKGQSRK